MSNPLEVSRADRDSALLRCVRYEVIYRFIRLRPDLFWVHAGAVASGGRTLILAGPWGCGKSTLVAQLCRQGWSYLSDDVAPVEPHSARVLPFPVTPMMRVKSEHAEDRVALREKTRIRLQAHEICRERISIGAFVFPSYSLQGVERIEPCAPGEAVIELLRQGLNSKDLQGTSVRYACDLVERLRPFADLS